MPAMVRPKGKAKKVAYALIGVPASFQGKKVKSRINGSYVSDMWRMR